MNRSFTAVNEDHISSENVSEIIKNYEFHPSIIKIKENVEIKEKFKFVNVNPEIIKDEIDKLNPKKACFGNDIPVKLLMGNSDIVCEPLANIYNNSKNNQKYPISLKDVTPVHKPNQKNEKVYRKNYRPVSLTPIV